MGCSEEHRHDEHAQQHAVVQQRRKLLEGELTSTLQLGEHHEYEHEDEGGDDGDAQKRHSPAYIKSDHTTQWQTYNHGYRRTGGNGAQS